MDLVHEAIHCLIFVNRWCPVFVSPEWVSCKVGGGIVSGVDVGVEAFVDGGF